MLFFFLFKQKTAYELRISDWSSDVCSSDLQRMQLDRLAFDQGRLERLDAQTMQGRRAIQQHRMLADHLFEDVPDLRPLLLDHLQIGRASCRERVCQYV